MLDSKNMKVCAYVMTVDSGLAPNPFHGICTLAVCTPNHVRANLNRGDYVIGIAGVGLCNKLKTPGQLRLIYAMKVDKRLELGEYYDAAEYRLKRPRLKGSREEMCGDNFYRKINGSLTHTRETEEHTGPSIEKQDCDGNRVFIGKEFSYFGSAAPEIPQQSNWGGKLVSQLKRRSVNVTYIYGGRSGFSWTENELKEFFRFLDDNKIDYIPTPVDFDGWDSEPDRKSSCAA